MAQANPTLGFFTLLGIQIRETTLTLARAFAIYLDNRYRKIFGVSYLLHRPNVSRNFEDWFSVHENVAFHDKWFPKLKVIDPISRNTAKRFIKPHIFLDTDNNIAVSNMRTYCAFWALSMRQLKPSEVCVITPSKRASMNILLRGFGSVTDYEALSQSANGYVLEQLFMPRKRAFWEMLADASCLEEYRLYLLNTFNIRPAPPVRSVRRVTLIGRRNYDENINGRKIEHIAPRKIANEEAVLTTLRKHFPRTRFDRVFMEDLPIEEQFQLINETDLLLGMHGAGLAHTFAMPAGAGVLELLPCHFRQRHYFYTFYAIATARGLPYERWIQYRLWRDRTSPEFKRPNRKRKIGRICQGRDLSHVPPRAIVKRVASLMRQINK